MGAPPVGATDPSIRASFPSPFGPVTLVESGGVLVALEWRGGAGDTSALLAGAGLQLAAYFAGHRRAFDLPLALGHGFRAQFLAALCAIPFGQTRTYGQLALHWRRGSQA